MWPRPPTPPSRVSAGAAPVRLIVRRVKPTPGSQLALFATYSYHGFITDRDGEMPNWRLIIAVTPRSRTPFETSSTAWGLNHMPSARFAANAAWLAIQVMAITSPAGRRGLVWANVVTTKTLQAAGLPSVGRITRSARRLRVRASPPCAGLGSQFSRALARCEPFHSRP